MPDIILPGRVRSLSARPQSQSDPGLDLPDDVKQAMERQTRLHDATGAMTIHNEAMRTLRDGLDQRVDQADFADEAVRGDFGTFVGNTIAEAKKRYQGLTGAARLSDAAMGRLDGDLEFTGQVFRDRGDTLHLQGVERRGIEQLTSLADETASRVGRQVAVAPIGDAFMFLAGELDVFDETTAGYTGAFKANQERDLLKAGRVAIIEATLIGLTELGRGAEAQVLLRHEEAAPPVG